MNYIAISQGGWNILVEINNNQTLNLSDAHRLVYDLESAIKKIERSIEIDHESKLQKIRFERCVNGKV